MLLSFKPSTHSLLKSQEASSHRLFRMLQFFSNIFLKVLSASAYCFVPKFLEFFRFVIDEFHFQVPRSIVVTYDKSPPNSAVKQQTVIISVSVNQVFAEGLPG